MQVKLHYQHINDIAQTELGIIWNTESEIHIPFLNIVDNVSINKNEYIGDARVINKDLFVYIKSNYNSSYKIINNKGEVVYTSNTTLLKRQNGIIYESGENYSIKISKEEGLAKVLIVSIDYSLIHFVDEHYFVAIPFDDSTTMTLWSAETFQPIWSITTQPNTNDLPESVDGREYYYFINAILGRIQNLLFVRLNSYKIIGLDLISGEQVKEIHQPDRFPESFKIYDTFKNHINLNFQLDIDKQILFGLHSYWYFEYDLKAQTDQYVVWDIREELWKNEINAVNGQVKWPSASNLVLFTNSGLSTKPNNVGVFNRASRAVKECWQTLSVKYDEGNSPEKYMHPTIRNMILCNGYVYIHYNSENKDLFISKF